jgi:hypothetical protein
LIRNVKTIKYPNSLKPEKRENKNFSSCKILRDKIKYPIKDLKREKIKKILFSL